MENLSIKRLLFSSPDLPSLDKIMKAFDVPFFVMDKNKIILENDKDKVVTQNSCPIKIENQVIGWVSSDSKAEEIAMLLSYLCEVEYGKRLLVGEIFESYREQLILQDLSEKLGAASFDLDEISELVVDETMKRINASVVSVFLSNNQDETLELLSEYYMDEKTGSIIKLEDTRLHVDDGIVQTVYNTGKSEVVNDVQSDPRYSCGKNPFLSMICSPLKESGKVIGVLAVGSEDSVLYTSKELKLFSTISSQAALAIGNALMYNILKETFFETVKALSETIELRDTYTGGHTYRVMRYSLAISEELQLSKEEMNNLMLAALMHDIGKIGICDKILLKDEKLTPDEYEVMKSHSKIGSEILKNIKQLKDIIPAVRDHHEKYEGTGYPNGLKGDEISILARIIAVADSFDAMTSDRAYRKSLDLNAAFEELRKHSNTQFDGKVVEAFFNAYKSSRLKVNNYFVNKLSFL